MVKSSTLRFKDEKTKKYFLLLETGDTNQQRLFKNLHEVFLKLEENPFSGIHISKRLIPKEFKKYDIQNLWKYNLPDGMRVLYSVYSKEDLVVIVIDWLSHKKYERRFKY